MSGRIAWDVELLHDHARRVARIGDDVGEAAAAVRSLGLSGGAFGLLCSFLVPPATTISHVAARTIDGSEALMERTGVQLRGLAGDAEEFERDAAASLKSLDGELW